MREGVAGEGEVLFRSRGAGVFLLFGMGGRFFSDETGIRWSDEEPRTCPGWRRAFFDCGSYPLSWGMT